MLPFLTEAVEASLCYFLKTGWWNSNAQTSEGHRYLHFDQKVVFRWPQRSSKYDKSGERPCTYARTPEGGGGGNCPPSFWYQVTLFQLSILESLWGSHNCTLMHFLYLYINRHRSWLDFWKIQVNLVNFIFLHFWGRLGEKFQKWPYFWAFGYLMFDIFS